MAAPGEPTQEEIEAYFAQLREVPSGELVMQALSMLAAGAQAKLGLRDARVLIDSMDAVLGVAGGALGPAGQEIANSVGQLKMAQVQLEKQQPGQDQTTADQPPGTPGQPPRTPGQTAGTPGQPPASGPQTGGPDTGGDGKMTDRLWIPGR